MTKKILLPLLLALPLALASCGNSAPAEPGAFERGDNLLTADVLKAGIAERNDGYEVSKKTLDKALLDAEANPEWANATTLDDFNAGFLVYQKSVTDTESGITTVTHEAYNKATLELVVSWETNDDPEALEVEGVVLAQAPKQGGGYVQGLGIALYTKQVYVLVESVPELDHIEMVYYDSFGHKLLECTDEHPGNIAFIVSNSMTMMRLVKWSKDHYEQKMEMYYDGFTKILAIDPTMIYPLGFFYPVEYEVKHDDVVYKFVEDMEKLEVYKEGVEKAVTSIEWATLEAGDVLGYQVFEENIIYVKNKEVPNDAKDFTYLSHNMAGLELKTKQEVHNINLFTGEDKLVDTKGYAVSEFGSIELDEESEAIPYIALISIREDKTLEPASEKVFFTDEKLVLHDEITNTPLLHIENVFRVGDHYFYDYEDPDTHEHTYYVYDENMKYAGVYAENLELSGIFGDKVVMSNVFGQIAVFNEVGEVLMPFTGGYLVNATEKYAEVDDAAGNVGILDFAKASITWLDMEVVSKDPYNLGIVYVQHNVAPEGEPEELNYKTYFGGEYFGDFEYKLHTKLTDYGVVGNNANDAPFFYMLLTDDVIAEDTSVTEYLTSYILVL